MTHPSPTAAEVKRFLEHVRDVAAEKDRELTKERAEQALTHIAALEARLGEVERLRAVVIKCRDQFDKYAVAHEMKGTEDGFAKAKTNHAFANECREALLSGAATPAPTAALTEEEHSQVEDARYHAEKYPSEWWSEAILELTDIIDRIATKPAKSTPQGAEE